MKELKTNIEQLRNIIASKESLDASLAIRDKAVSHREHETVPEDIRNKDREEIWNIFSCNRCSFTANDDKQLNKHIFMEHITQTHLHLHTFNKALHVLTK